MSGFRPKRPKKPRKPSEKFLARKAAEAEAKQKEIPDNGPVRLFLDDERQAPEGWTLVRSPNALRVAINDIEPGRIEGLSLDWHLGSGVTNGEKVVEDLLILMKDRPDIFAGLSMVHLHSSDREKAVAMARQMATPTRESWDGIPYYGVDVGMPFRREF